MTIKQLAARSALGVAALVPLASHAVIDVTSTTTAIGEVSVALLAVIGAMLAVSIAILGIGKVYGFVKRKAGG